MSGNPDLEKFSLAVIASLKSVLGDSGAKAILFYLGDPTPETFETKLRSILGEGAPIIIQDLNKRLEGDGISHKHHWLGGHI